MRAARNRSVPVAVIGTALALAACGTTSTATPPEQVTTSTAGASSDAASGTFSVTKKGTGLTVEHAQGTTELAATPTRVAVLDFGVLDTMDALDLEASVVGATKTMLPPFLSTYAKDSVVDLGAMKEPSLEKLAALKPDLVVVQGRSAAKYAEVAKIAPTIDLTHRGTDVVAGVKGQANTLAEIFGAQATAKTALTALDTKIDAARAKAVNAGPSLVLMTSGGKVSAFGAKSRFGLIHDTLGVPTTDMSIKDDPHGQAVSFELIRTADPSHLFVVDRDAAVGESGKAAAQVLDNALVRGTTAWKEKKVTYLDSARWYLVTGGLNNTPAMIDEVAAAL